MVHSFLVEPGRWTLQGSWLERDRLPTPVKGKILIVLTPDNWFTMAMKLVLPRDDQAQEMALQYRGRLISGNRQYTFVLQHSQLGRVEGEGWVAPDSIIQRYWALDDRQRRTGFETLYRIDEGRYHLSSGIMTGHSLTSAMEATLHLQGVSP
ncbi:MAG TPA: hypothetical protein IGR64_19095 [Leptolyngbyaceae cyanobacterium M65_K2018_010]|nr:hypothetical protein [Leptolyngbyaceae cyanobacterium M65_K2018_010]